MFCSVVRFCTRTCNFPLQTSRRPELRPHLPKLRLVENRSPRTTQQIRQYPAAYQIPKGIPERCAVLGSAPCALGTTALSSRGNLTATRRCGTTIAANPSDGRNGYCTPPAPRQHPRNQHGKTKEERREGGSKQPKDRPDAPPAGAGTGRPRPGTAVCLSPCRAQQADSARWGKGCASALLKGVVHGPAHRLTV